MQTYTYINTDFKNTSQVNIEDLQNIVKNSSIESAVVQYINYNDTGEDFVVDIIFDTALSNDDKNILDEIIEEYTFQVYTDTFATIKDIKPVGTNGGTFTSGTWQKRTLNTIEGNINFVSISNSQILIQPGSYTIIVKAPACNVRNHQCRLQNITDNISIMGINSFSYNDVMTNSDIYTVINIEEEKTFEIQHICSDTVVNIGFGKATGFASDELYTVVSIQKTS